MATSDNHEVVVATEAWGQQWSAAAWDLQTGNSVRTFKGFPVGQGCLCMRSGHSLIGAAACKPFLQIWPLCKQDETQQKIFCPGTIHALAVSPDGLFCVASIGEKIYIWEMTAGNLLGLLSSHDEVKKIQFTDDGSHFAVGTTSGLLQIWNFAHVVSVGSQLAKGARAVHTISAHPEAITDIHVGCGGPAARVATASTDATCKLWDMQSGELIRTFVYESSVQSVIMDKCERFLIAGLVSGLVICSPLYGQISQAEVFVSKHATKAGELVLQAHTKGTTASITCLALSSDDSQLAAGLHDGTVIVWNLEEGSAVISRNLSGAVGNVMIIPPIVPSSTSAHSGPAVSFKQQIAREDEGRGRVFNVTIPDTSELSLPDFSADIAEMFRLSSSVEQQQESVKESADIDEKIASLQKEIANLKEVKKDLTSNTSQKTGKTKR